jgi:hypothetical protein
VFKVGGAFGEFWFSLLFLCKKKLYFSTLSIKFYHLEKIEHVSIFILFFNMYISRNH